MARKCSCCTSPSAGDIDAALIAGTPIRDVAGRHGVSRTAVARHATDHLPDRIAASRVLIAAVDRREGARRLATMTRGEFVLEALGRLEAAHDQAVADGDVRARIAAVDAQLRAMQRFGIVGNEDGLVRPITPTDRAEQQAEELKAMATDLLVFTQTLREQMGVGGGNLIETTAEPDG